MAKTTLTKAEWAEVKAKLEHPLVISFLKFKIDDHIVSAESHIYNRRVIINIYVDGWQRGEWFTKPNEFVFVPRLYPTIEKFLFSKKIRDNAKKAYGVRRYKTHGQDYEQKYHFHTTCFKSVASMKRLWESNNDSIQLIKE